MALPSIRPAPALAVFFAAFVGLALAALATLYAVQQPWLGVGFGLKPDGSGLVVTAVHPDGPASVLTVGAEIAAVTSDSTGSVSLEPADIAEEPDAVDSFSQLNRFFARQGMIASALVGSNFGLVTGEGDTILVDVAPSRPLTSLRTAFWVQLSVAFVAVVIGALVWSLRPRNAGTQLLLVCGIALIFSAYPSAVYMGRELALPEGAFRTLNIINSMGSSTFTVALLVLFLVHPRQILSWRWIALIAGAFALLLASDYLQVGITGPHLGRYMVTSLPVVGALIAAGVQYRLAKNDPVQRAALQWFALSLALAFGIYVVLFAVPIFLGQPAVTTQAVAYALGLVVYAGMALSIARYRLFDVDRLGFLILFYVGGALLLLAIDATLILALATDARIAFAVSLLLVALVYLPLRDVLWRRLAPRTRLETPELFKLIIDLAFAPTVQERRQQWTDILKRLFDPMRIAVPDGETGNAVSVGQDGLVLTLPRTEDLPATELHYPWRGKGLFAARHQELAINLVDLIRVTEANRHAYDAGVIDERTRISRDMHDNVGAQLLSALHSPALNRKNQMIAQSISDLRDIIRNSTDPNRSVNEVLADLRAETAERLDAAGLTLVWTAELQELALSSEVVLALRSIVREGVSNVVRHAKAQSVAITITAADQGITITIEDDGVGMDIAKPTSGDGIRGMKARVAALGGDLTLTSSPDGTILTARLTADAMPVLEEA